MSIASDNAIYVTSFCQRAHRMKNGNPIAHECYRIPPKLLRAERDDSPDCEQLWQEWSQGPRKMVRGQHRR